MEYHQAGLGIGEAGFTLHGHRDEFRVAGSVPAKQFRFSAALPLVEKGSRQAGNYHGQEQDDELWKRSPHETSPQQTGKNEEPGGRKYYILLRENFLPVPDKGSGECEAIRQSGVAFAPGHLIFTLVESLADGFTNAGRALFTERQAMIGGIQKSQGYR